MSAQPDRDRDSLQLPDDLPPVQPPSPGFIVQLFLIPGLIVLAIVVIWVGMNRLVSAEQDWRALVAELQDPRELVRWRGAFGLAQLLQADQRLGGSGPHLVANSEVAGQLSELLISELKRNSQKTDDLQQQAFLARTLGLFHLPGAVLPALRIAMQPQYDLEIRKNALGAIAVIAGREADAGRTLDDPELLADLINVSRESEYPLIRQMAAFDLGLLAGEKPRERLEVMLGDSDQNVQVNAAVGLARHNSTLGLQILEQVLGGADQRIETGSDAEFHKYLILKNTVTALGRLVPALSAAQKAELILLLAPVAKNFREPSIRLSAEQVLVELQTHATE